MHRIGIVVFPDFQVMAFAAVTVFEIVNAVAAEPFYDVHVVSEAGGPLRTSLGMTIETEALRGAVFDTLLVTGGLLPRPSSPGLLELVRAAPATCRRVAAVCLGAFVLAEAGLLDGRRATTHWAFARELATRFPEVEVEEDRIFIADGAIWTSAGMTAGIDLALALVEADRGATVARDVAKKLVMYHRRAGGQSQFSKLLELAPKSDRIQDALAHARAHLRQALAVEDLAAAAHLSPRQFSRAFRAETGQSPAKAVEQLRVEAARLMLEEGHHSLDEVADETGFADRERMRRAFLRAFGQPPQVIRRNAARAS